jgi:hypothetical protein
MHSIIVASISITIISNMLLVERYFTSLHLPIQVRAVSLSRECRFRDELLYHLMARWHGAEDEFRFNRRMQVRNPRKKLTLGMCKTKSSRRDDGA